MKSKIFILTIIINFLFGLSAHAISNPASVKCAEMKGLTTVIVNELGESGLCTFGKAMIEEWTLFRALAGEKQKAIEAYKKSKNNRSNSNEAKSLANPASTYCATVGGKSVLVKVAISHDEMRLCTFSDGSQIDEWTLFHGPSNDLNTELNHALGIDIDSP